jgi:hypothetical protein
MENFKDWAELAAEEIDRQLKIYAALYHKINDGFHPGTIPIRNIIARYYLKRSIPDPVDGGSNIVEE